jgi:hypothetical protein
MAFFKLKSGGYVGRKRGTEGETPTGRAEQINHKPGDIIESDKNLVALHGSEKFDYHGESARGGGQHAPLPPGQPPPDNPIAFPGGQVAEGFQQTGGGKPSHSEAAQPDELRQRGLIPTQDDEPARSQQRAEPMAHSMGKDSLDNLTVEELRQLARERDIGLGGARNRDEILKAIRAKQAGK